VSARSKFSSLNRDPDALIPLQHFVEEAGLETTIPWDGAETRNFVAHINFD